MVEKIIWSNKASENFDSITEYLIANWGEKVLIDFKNALSLKLETLKANPNLGFKSSRYSAYRRTLLKNHYLLIYSYSKNIITINRIKHSSQNK